MQLEFWMPKTEQLKNMTDELMDRRMGEDWRVYFDPKEEMYRLKTMIGWPEGQFLMTAGELEDGSCSMDCGTAWSGTTTEALYRDTWGTALMDAGREIVKSYIANKRCGLHSNGFDKEEDAVISDAKGRLVLCGPGLNGVPNETMKQLYERLEGWRIGVKLNEAYVLSPAKSFGGWFEAEGTTPGVDHICRPGVGCQFCILRGTQQCKQHRRGLRPEDRTKGEIQLPQDVLWEEKPVNGAGGFGIAFDIGTTTVAAMLWDLSEPGIAPLTSGTIPNPQRIHGVDVISRIEYAQGSSQRIAELQEMILGAMRELTTGLVSELWEAVPGSKVPVNIRRISVVGNTTIMHFLFGKDPSGLAAAPFRGEELPLEIHAKALGFGPKRIGEELWSLTEDAAVRTLPVMGGHLGSDAAAVLLALRLPEETEPALVMDIGTNGELLFTDGRGQTYGCSTAAGPAFEGASVSPGSKFIDAAASMLNQGWMDEDGLVSRPGLLDQKDIRQLQMAKGAIAAGAELLTAKSVGSQMPDRMILAGTFGNHIRPESAVRIGLVPKGTTIESCGNAAGVGASLILLSDKEWERGIRWAKTVAHVELADEPAFTDHFLRNMNFPL